LKTFFILPILLYALAGQAAGTHSGDDTRMAAKGRKIVEALCERDRLPSVTPEMSREAVMQAVEESHACIPLGRSRLAAVAAFLQSGTATRPARHRHHIEVPPGAKCPVCGMIVSKYPKWAAKMVVAGEPRFFDGVKDMMKYYFFDGDFPYDRRKIDAIVVSDYYTLEALDARSAWYVTGSDVLGPMGNELIAFKTRDEAENFIRDHGGDGIVRFDQITPAMVMALDGIEYHE
jgi:nitrous oxide reductase accessory protein NosL